MIYTQVIVCCDGCGAGRRALQRPNGDLEILAKMAGPGDQLGAAQDRFDGWVLTPTSQRCRECVADSGREASA